MEEVIPRRDRAVDELVEVVLGRDGLRHRLLIARGRRWFAVTGN
jgi:hypothetical protein